MSDCRFFSVSRRRTEPEVGRVFFLGFGGSATSMIKSRSLFKQSATFRPWSRKRWLEITKSFSWLIRFAYFLMKRILTASGSDLHFAGDHLSIAFELTLLTFWPPGPGDLAKLNLNSVRRIEIFRLTLSIPNLKHSQPLKHNHPRPMLLVGHR